MAEESSVTRSKAKTLNGDIEPAVVQVRSLHGIFLCKSRAKCSESWVPRSWTDEWMEGQNVSGSLVVQAREAGPRGVANVLVLVRVRTRRKVGARKVYTGAVRCGW